MMSKIDWKRKLSMASVVSYIITEGKVDAESVKKAMSDPAN